MTPSPKDHFLPAEKVSAILPSGPCTQIRVYTPTAPPDEQRVESFSCKELRCTRGDKKLCGTANALCRKNASNNDMETNGCHSCRLVKDSYSLLMRSSPVLVVQTVRKVHHNHTKISFPPDFTQRFYTHPERSLVVLSCLNNHCTVIPSLPAHHP